MQKKLIALAIAGLSSVAFAQSNVTIYGVVDGSLENIKATGATATAAGVNDVAQNLNGRNRFVSNSSYIGFKGTEELGNGMKALFQIENQFALDNVNDNSAGTAPNRLANRDSFVGLTGGFGTVIAGYLSTPHRTLGASADVVPGATGVAGFNNLLGKLNIGASLNANGFNNNNGNTFADNYNSIFRSQALAYVTPTVAGLSGVVAYVPNETKTSLANNAAAGTATLNTSAWNVAVNYANGPLKAGYSFLTSEDPLVAAGSGIFGANTSSKLKSHLVVGSYAIGDLTLGLQYNQNKLDIDTAANVNNVVTGVKNTVWGMNAKYVMGANEFALVYQKANDGSLTNKGVVAGTSGAADRGAKNLSLRYGYNLSKRTQAYVVYSEIKNDKNGNYDFGAGLSANNTSANNISAGADPKSFGIGLRHSF